MENPVNTYTTPAVLRNVSRRLLTYNGQPPIYLLANDFLLYDLPGELFF